MLLESEKNQAISLPAVSKSQRFVGAKNRLAKPVRSLLTTEMEHIRIDHLSGEKEFHPAVWSK